MLENVCKEIFDLIFNHNEKGDIHYSFDYFKEMFEYTTMGGKGTRGKTVVNTYRHVAGLNFDENNLRKAEIIGCCIEILQASFLVHDDIMDNSEMRRQKPCWYLKAESMGYGKIAINDGLFLNTVIHKTLSHYFRSESYYIDLIDLFNETIERTSTGQCLDMLTAPMNLEKYTIQRYESIVRWKTAYYSFYLPVICGMIIGGITDKNLWKSTEKILLKIGEYFQVQDDFLDCFGDPSVIGKIGHDIEDSKCSWLIVQALQCADQDQLIELQDNYGKDDAVCVDRVKKIFLDLDLEGLYHKYEDDTYNEVMMMIKNISNGARSVLPAQIFTDLLNIMYKRNK